MVSGCCIFLPLNCNIHPVHQGIIPNAYTTNHTRSFLLYSDALSKHHTPEMCLCTGLCASIYIIHIHVWLRELPSCNQTFNTWPFLPKINWTKMHILLACIDITTASSQHHIKTTIAVVSWIRIQFFYFPIANLPHVWSLNVRVLVDPGRNIYCRLIAIVFLEIAMSFPQDRFNSSTYFRVFLNDITKIPVI